MVVVVAAVATTAMIMMEMMMKSTMTLLMMIITIFIVIIVTINIIINTIVNIDLCGAHQCRTLRSPLVFVLENLKVSDQNGISLLYIMLEIHHSGREPSKYPVFFTVEIQPLKSHTNHFSERVRKRL